MAETASTSSDEILEKLSLGSKHSRIDDEQSLEFFYGKFCQQIPRIVWRQMISKLVNQYVHRSKSTDNFEAETKCFDLGVDINANSTIYRFHGSLLFVDISGFTILSQKLKVDDLKNQINSYFQKIVDIIDKYDGEIIKFAGDALFIVWQTKQTEQGDDHFQDAAKDAVRKAVSCGTEINIKCSNYAINLDVVEDSRKVSEVIRSVQASKGMFEYSGQVAQADPLASGGKASPHAADSNSNATRGPSVTYLNVHAGVSMGVMAGIDVGANDRFEYLLLGGPIKEVAVAEGDAGTGEIVISPAAHDLLHPCADLCAAGTVPGPVMLSCGCTRTISHFFKICHPTETEAADCAAQIPVAASSNDLQHEFDAHTQVIEGLMSGFNVISSDLLTQFASVHRDLLAASNNELDSAGAAAHPESRRAAVEYAVKEVVMEHFFCWSQHCLLDDIAKHVHEVVRNGYTFYQETRVAPFEQFLASPACLELFRAKLKVALHTTACRDTTLSAASVSSSFKGYMRTVSSASVLSEATSVHPSEPAGASKSCASKSGAADSFVSKMRLLTGVVTRSDDKHSMHLHVLESDSALASELRNVVVLFISVKMGNTNLLLDPVQQPPLSSEQAAASEAVCNKPIQTCLIDSFSFLSRTVNEIEADRLLINHFHSCMEVMTDVLHSRGGQLRQFIVDDKGTVCIGTFGLKGSVNCDDAAAAVDSANQIIIRLQLLGFNASVGVTSGSAYCGPVGSHTRHEYAVMGPSTNLSARLMGRAQEGEIICDSAIRQRDRAHTYTSLGAVKAKGYAKLVSIFKPEFPAAAAALSPTQACAPAVCAKRRGGLRTQE